MKTTIKTITLALMLSCVISFANAQVSKKEVPLHLRYTKVSIAVQTETQKQIGPVNNAPKSPNVKFDSSAPIQRAYRRIRK
jgi:hypothetical protein